LTLRSRLTVAAAAAVAVAVVLASALVYVLVRSELRGRIDDSLERGARLIALLATRLDAPLEPGVQVFPRAPLEGIRFYVQAITDEGVAAPRRGGRGLIPVSDRARAAAAGEADAFFADAEVGGTHLRVYTRPLEAGVAVQLARSLEEVDATLARLRWVLAAISLGGIGLAAVLGLLVSRSALRPVAELTETAERVTETRDLSRRIDVEGQDEVARLARSFNTMLEALESSLSSQRRLVADASHELRTPLTSLRTNIEVLARAGDLPQSDRERILQDLVRQTEELSLLVEDVVELARGDAGSEAWEDVRLDLLVADVVDTARTHAPGIRFDSRLDPCVVHGAPGRMARAVRNLLDNAAKWSPPGAVVEVSVAHGEVTVRDHGPGIADADLPHVFDRFYRAPSARGLPGSGLGLAIVREVALAHGGSVSVERPDNGGSLFRLSFVAAS
jgi:two-component system sensor histidine kinase MprB